MNINSSQFGMTIQKLICEKYNIKIDNHTESQFNSNFREEYKKDIHPIIDQLFKDLKSDPVECTTFKKSLNPGERTLPYNFILKNGKTLSIRTNRKGDKVAPRSVGQAGYEKLNYHFGHLVDYEIKDQNDIKHMIFENIHRALPIFIDYMFTADYTVWIYYSDSDKFEYVIINRDQAPDLIFKRDELSFTCENIDKWKESTTLKYKNKSIAEIQVHKNRSFKFRFSMNNLMTFLRDIKITTETLGMTAEKVICDLFDLEREDHINKRSSRVFEKEITPSIVEAFKHLPKAIEHSGSKSGERGGTSKSSYDFILEGNKTLSLKTNYGKKVCPPEVGQPSSKTFMIYFGDLLDEPFSDDAFKRLVLEKIHFMIPRYLEHLLDSDYLLWIYKEKEAFNYKIIESINLDNLKWNREDFSFTRDSLDTWKESTTVKYKGISMGEFQIHKSRNSYKFRFDMKKLLIILENEEIIL